MNPWDGPWRPFPALRQACLNGALDQATMIERHEAERALALSLDSNIFQDHVGVSKIGDPNIVP